MCKVGAHRTQRHDRIVRCLETWLQKHGHATRRELHYPQLDKHDGIANEKKGVIDITAVHGTTTHLIDVSVTSPLLPTQPHMTDRHQHTTPRDDGNTTSDDGTTTTRTSYHSS